MVPNPEAGPYRGRLIVSAGLVAILIGGFLPWLRSGRAWRDSYEMVATADRLGLVESGLHRVLAVSWYLVPLLCGLTLAAIALDRQWLSLLGTMAVAGLVAVTVAVAVRASAPSGSGPRVAGIGVLLAVGGAVIAAGDRRGPRAAGPRRRKSFLPAVTRTGGRWRRSAR